MALQVCFFHSEHAVRLQNNCISVAGDPDNDYNAVSGLAVQFNVGDTSRTHTIMINDDMICEDEPNEMFFSNIALGPQGRQPIFLIQPQATVTIDDSAEAECCKIFNM